MSWEVSTYLELGKDERERFLQTTQDAVRLVVGKHCDLLVAEAALIIWDVLPAAAWVEFVFERSASLLTPWAITVHEIGTAEDEPLYVDERFVINAKDGHYDLGERWPQEKMLRDKLSEICELGRWYLGDPAVDTRLRLPSRPIPPA